MSPWQHNNSTPSLPVRSSNTSVISRTSTPGGSSFTQDLQPPPPLPDATSIAGSDENLDGGDGSRTKLQCPFCTEYGIGQWIGRKPDLKRHFNKIHASNAHWTCKLGGGCNLTFDFHTAYDAHVKQDHGGVKDPDAKASTCQQVVWACGFETCREVFEAKTDDHGPKVMNNYFEHVLGHVVSSACGKWSYSRRMRNLLQQAIVRDAWKDCDKGSVEELLWQPQNSSILRKMLETRHINDAILLCRYAVLLGSGHSAPAIASTQFSVPLINSCKIVSPNHDPRRDARFSKGSSLLNKFSRSSKPSTPRPSGRITGSQPKNRVTVLRAPAQLSTIPPPTMRSPPVNNFHFPPMPMPVRSPPPVPNMPSSSMMNIYNSNAPTSAPQIDPMPSYSSPSDFNMGSVDGTSTPMGFADHSPLPTLDYHPLELYAGYQSLGEPPSLHQFLSVKDDHNSPTATVPQNYAHSTQSANSTHHYAQKIPADNNLPQQHYAQKTPQPSTEHKQQQHYRPRRNSSPSSDCRMGGESPVQGFAQQYLPGRQDLSNTGRRRSSTTMDFVFSQ